MNIATWWKWPTSTRQNWDGNESLFTAREVRGREHNKQAKTKSKCKEIYSEYISRNIV